MDPCSLIKITKKIAFENRWRICSEPVNFIKSTKYDFTALSIASLQCGDYRLSHLSYGGRNKKTGGKVKESNDTHWGNPSTACSDGYILKVFCSYSTVFPHLPGSHLYVFIPHETTFDQIISMASP